jgi:BirA family biotin operon repressor/biotin-[acetyl-CoA-carboxylase] ligase
VGSTNDWLKAQVRAGAPEWSAVVADEQTAGRGRHARRWVMQPGDLALSVLVLPPDRPDALLLLPLATGVAVAEAAAGFGAEAALKWPNDVVVERPGDEGTGYRKMAGILVEGVSVERVTTAVVGVGLNLVPIPAGELRATATSLGEECGRDVARDEAAAAVLARIRVWYDALARGDASAIVHAFTARALPWWGRMVEVLSGGTAVRGLARGIDGRGALLIEKGDGTVEAVVSGEARQVRLR